MMDDDQTRKSEYEVGYGRPPKSSRFKKGRSGNPHGRPKGSGRIAIDINQLDAELLPATINGVTRRIPAFEVALRQILNKALTGDIKAILYLFQCFEDHGVIERAPTVVEGGVFVMPSGVPDNLARMALERFGPRHWTDAEIESVRPDYEAQYPNDIYPTFLTIEDVTEDGHD